MKNKKYLVHALFLILATWTINLNANENAAGYKEFTLGQSYSAVKSIITGKYSGNQAKYWQDGDIQLQVAEMVTATLYFDHTKTLYMIHVEIKYGDISKVKKALMEKYGQPNDYSGEEYDRGNKMYLMGRWKINNKIRITASESYYCRNQKFRPCILNVDYTDEQRASARNLHLRKSKEDEKKKEDKKTYDGF